MDIVFIFRTKILGFAGFLQESDVYDIAHLWSFRENQIGAGIWAHVVGLCGHLSDTVEYD